MYNTIPSNPFPPSSANVSGGGGGQYVLPVASADTLGGVKVGAGLSIADGVLSANGVIFSTEEREVGTWINGEKLFERSFVLIENGVAKYEKGGLENKSYLIGMTGFEIAFISNFVGVRDVAVDSMPIANTSYYTFDKVNGAIFVSTTFSFTHLIVTVRYTKTESEG